MIERYSLDYGMHSINSFPLHSSPFSPSLLITLSTKFLPLNTSISLSASKPCCFMCVGLGIHNSTEEKIYPWENWTHEPKHSFVVLSNSNIRQSLWIFVEHHNMKGSQQFAGHSTQQRQALSLLFHNFTKLMQTEYSAFLVSIFFFLEIERNPQFSLLKIF